MTENDSQAQGQDAPDNSSKETQSQQGQQTQSADDNSKGVMIPKSRLDEEARKRREAEQELKRIQQEQEQAAEDRQQKQGEYQELANKRQKKIEKLEAELKQVKSDWTRERRMNVWNQGAQGVIRAEAISDAFSFLSEDELSGIDDTDEKAFTQLAQNLAEVKPYLAVEGPRGAGSGGSREPVATGAGGRKPLFHDARQKRRQWK